MHIARVEIINQTMICKGLEQPKEATSRGSLTVVWMKMGLLPTGHVQGRQGDPLAPPNNSDDGGITSEDAQHKQGGSSV